MTRRFAQDTQVAVERSRGQINELLRRWGCHRIGWMDDEAGCELVFEFVHDGGKDGLQTLHARYRLTYPTDEELEQKAQGARGLRAGYLEKLQSHVGRREHRLLLLLLKANLEAVEEGLLDPAVVFLPYIVTDNGQTVGERVISDLPKALRSSPLMLGSGRK